MKTIKIDGTEYPVLPRYSSLRRFCGKKGIELNQFPEYLVELFKGGVTNQFIDDITLLAYNFIERGLEQQGEAITLSMDDVLDWVMLPGNVNIVVELVNEAQGIDPKKIVKAQKKSSLK